MLDSSNQMSKHALKLKYLQFDAKETHHHVTRLPHLSFSVCSLLYLLPQTQEETHLYDITGPLYQQSQSTILHKHIRMFSSWSFLLLLKTRDASHLRGPLFTCPGV